MRLARGVLGGALLAGAVGVEQHAEAERSVGDLHGVARGLGAGAQTLGVVVLAAVGPVVADLVTLELVVELGVAPRVAGERRAGARLETVAAGGGDAVRRALAQPVRRQQELHPAVSVLLGGALLLPTAVEPRLEHGLTAFLSGLDGRRDHADRLVAGRRVGPLLGDLREQRRLHRLGGRAEELHVGEGRTRDQHEDDERDGQLGCLGHGVDRQGELPSLWPPPRSGPVCADGLTGGSTARPWTRNRQRV